MSMIQCPKCGNQISDKSSNCVHCGFVFHLAVSKYCTECGTKLNEGDTICPNCSCPVENAVPPMSTVPNTNQNNNKAKDKKHTLGIIIAIVAASILCVVGFVLFQQYKAQKEAALLHDYEYNMYIASLTMSSGDAMASSAGLLIRSVWLDSIYQFDNPKTTQYTCPDGVFVDDFNIALENLFSDPDFIKDLEDIQDNQKEVLSLMSELQDPPEEFKKAHELLSELYDCYLYETNLILSPTGSYNSYSDELSDAQSDFFSISNKVRVYVKPENIYD